MGLGDARWTSGFWADRWDTDRRVTIPTMKQVMELPDNSATFHNLRVAAGELEGKFVGNNWSDGDCYKWIEAAASVYSLNQDVTSCKMYITGVTAALHHGESRGVKLERRHTHVYEAFGAPYQLPNRMAYNETCANIANAMWSWRMLLLTGEASYADVMERVFCNSMLSAIGLDGKSYFYVNPLRRCGEDVPLHGYDLRLRIPGWVEQSVLRINGQVSGEELNSGSYSEIRRVWKAGDVVELELPMPAVLMESHPLAGVKPPAGLDGIFIAPTLLGDAAKQKARAYYWEAAPARALRQGDGKVYRGAPDRPVELYNLATDIGESRNVTAQHPEIAARLEELLTQAHVESAEFPLAAKRNKQ